MYYSGSDKHYQVGQIVTTANYVFSSFRQMLDIEQLAVVYIGLH